MGARFLFDAVLFDLDGTLIATDRFWVQAARTGARRAFRALGIERDLPTGSEWMGVVGYPLAQGFRALFPDLPDGQRDKVLEACVLEEGRLLDSGGAALMPGTEEVLEALATDGVLIGAASNCAQSYLTHMLDKLGLARWVQEARCLDTPGISNKADMLEDLLSTWGTRRAVMVGDRAGDWQAARENGLPHVHCAFGFAQEDVPAEAIIEDLGSLLPVLEARRNFLESLLDSMSLGRGPQVVAVTGPPAAGTSLFAADLQALLARRGQASQLVPMEAFLLPGGRMDGVAAPDGVFDYDELLGRVIDPFLAGESVVVRRVDPAGIPPEPNLCIEPSEILLLEGPGVLEPRVHARLRRLVRLEVDDEVSLARIAGRDARSLGPSRLLRVRAQDLPFHRSLEARMPVSGRSDGIRVDGTNVLYPALLP